MRRREFIGFFGGAATTLSINLRAARALGTAHIGFISGLDQSAAADFLNALRDCPATRGYTEPSTLKLETQYPGNRRYRDCRCNSLDLIWLYYIPNILGEFIACAAGRSAANLLTRRQGCGVAY
jgi:hypothetical protein